MEDGLQDARTTRPKNDFCRGVAPRPLGGKAPTGRRSVAMSTAQPSTTKWRASRDAETAARMRKGDRLAIVGAGDSFDRKRLRSGNREIENSDSCRFTTNSVFSEQKYVADRRSRAAAIRLRDGEIHRSRGS